jgi:hypothetical protein
MSISDHHSKFGPAIAPADPATEREQLIAANQAFAAALKHALRNGAETSAGVLATVRPKRDNARRAPRAMSGWIAKW